MVWHRPFRVFRNSLLAAAVLVTTGVAVFMLVPTALRPANGGGVNCREGAPTVRTTVPLSDLALATPLYAVEAAGPLLKLDPAAAQWQRLADHTFEIDPSVVPSPDGRWISISGVRRGGAASEYWLFDKKTGRHRHVHSHHAWGDAIPEFSPDSKALAFYVSYDSRWPDAAGAGLHVVATAAFDTVAAGNPSALPAEHSWAKAYWSADGAEVLLMMRDFKRPGEPGTAAREHYAYRVAAKRFERIVGAFAPNGGAEMFFRQGRRIPTFEQAAPQSRLAHPTLASPDGRWQARIDGNHALIVTGADGKAAVPGRGSYDMCGGVTIKLHGWLDASHVIFSERDTTYVFDAAGGRTAELIAGQPQQATLLW